MMTELRWPGQHPFGLMLQSNSVTQSAGKEVLLMLSNNNNTVFLYEQHIMEWQAH